MYFSILSEYSVVCVIGTLFLSPHSITSVTEALTKSGILLPLRLNICEVFKLPKLVNSIVATRNTVQALTALCCSLITDIIEMNIPIPTITRNNNVVINELTNDAVPILNTIETMLNYILQQLLLIYILLLFSSFPFYHLHLL
ncbi:MAG: hypothetical protein RSD85_02395 [Erysipelotrichaceae bacterium]